MGYKKASSNRAYDEFYCFHIQDFEEGDSIAVTIRGERVKGRVTSINKRENVVYWIDKDDKTYSSTIDDFSYLGEFDSNWLS